MKINSHDKLVKILEFLTSGHAAISMLVILRSRIIFSGSGEISEAHLKNLNLYD
jgi:hypothetical protein